MERPSTVVVDWYTLGNVANRAILSLTTDGIIDISWSLGGHLQSLQPGFKSPNHCCHGDRSGTTVFYDGLSILSHPELGGGDHLRQLTAKFQVYAEVKVPLFKKRDDKHWKVKKETVWLYKGIISEFIVLSHYEKYNGNINCLQVTQEVDSQQTCNHPFLTLIIHNKLNCKTTKAATTMKSFRVKTYFVT